MDKCKHDWAWLYVGNKRITFTCSKCGMDVSLDKASADEVRAIVRKELLRITREGIKTLKEGKKK